MLCPVSDALSRYSKVPSYALALLGLRQARKKTPRPPDPPDPSGHNFYIGYDWSLQAEPVKQVSEKDPRTPRDPTGYHARADSKKPLSARAWFNETASARPA